MKKRSIKGALPDAIEIGLHRILGEESLPEPGREKLGVFGGMSADALQDIEARPAEKRPADRTLWVPALEAHEECFGRAPYLVAGDRGFWSTTNE